MNEDVIFDYATQYCMNHEAPASVADFKLTDADYKEFKELVKSREFTYDRQTERMMKNLKEVAEFEGYLKDASEEFKALEKKLNHNLDRDLDTFSKEIKEFIAQDIVTRYFYQRGAVMQRLKDDKELDKAIEVLRDALRYQKILSVPVIEKESADKKDAGDKNKSAEKKVSGKKNAADKK